MCFKFLAKDLKQDKTVTVKVNADREKIARQKLLGAGYQPIAMVGVEAQETNQIKFQRTNKLRSLMPDIRLSRTPTTAFRRRVKLTSLIADYLAPFNLLG
jgi:hypothetical protein